MSYKFAVIGCGRIGERHALHISNLGLLVAVCDIDPDKAKELGNRYHCPYFTDIDDLLNTVPELDVVSVCTPNGLHATHTIKALKKGFHVLCEKPMAIRVHDAEQMVNESLKANRMLFIVKQNRFNPPVMAVKNLLDSGKLGKIFSVQLNCFWNRNLQYYSNSDWKGSMELDGGTLFTQFSHFIDLLYYFFGDISDVTGFSENYNHSDSIEFEDTGVIALRFHEGMIGTINYTVNSYMKNMEGSITIFAENGTIKIGGQYLNELEYQNIRDYTIEDLPPGNPPNYYGEYSGSMSNHDKVYQNVIDVLDKKGIIATNGYEGLKTVEIIDKIYRKIRK